VNRDERSRLRALANVAIPGPWRFAAGVFDQDGEPIAYPHPASIYSTGQCDANAEFIAAARSAVPALLDALDARDTRIARLEALLREAKPRLVGQWPTERDVLVKQIDDALKDSNNHTGDISG
jgi:hypothetical protein